MGAGPAAAAAGRGLGGGQPGVRDGAASARRRAGRRARHRDGPGKRSAMGGVARRAGDLSVCDAGMADASYAEFATGYGLDATDMAWFWARYAADASVRAAPLASVGRAALHGLPPVLVQAAELDVLRGEGEAMAARLREAGVEVRHAVSAGDAARLPFAQCRGGALARGAGAGGGLAARAMPLSAAGGGGEGRATDDGGLAGEPEPGAVLADVLLAAGAGRRDILGAGWCEAEASGTWTGAAEAGLLLPLRPGTRDCVLRLSAAPYRVAHKLGVQRVLVLAGGRLVGRLRFDAPGVAALAIPADATLGRQGAGADAAAAGRATAVRAGRQRRPPPAGPLGQPGGAAGSRARGPGPTLNRAEAGAGDAGAPAATRGRSPADRALLEGFESLGWNEEFGFVQRRVLAEPAGLLRWASWPLGRGGAGGGAGRGAVRRGRSGPDRGRGRGGLVGRHRPALGAAHRDAGAGAGDAGRGSARAGGVGAGDAARAAAGDAARRAGASWCTWSATPGSGVPQRRWPRRSRRRAVCRAAVGVVRGRRLRCGGAADAAGRHAAANGRRQGTWRGWRRRTGWPCAGRRGGWQGPDGRGRDCGSASNSEPKAEPSGFARLRPKQARLGLCP